MTLFVALVGVGTFAYFAYDYLVSESRLPELLERYRSLSSAPEESVAQHGGEPDYRDLDAMRSRRDQHPPYTRAA